MGYNHHWDAALEIKIKNKTKNENKIRNQKKKIDKIKLMQILQSKITIKNNHFIFTIQYNITYL